jgi:hypothetical protein
MSSREELKFLTPEMELLMGIPRVKSRMHEDEAGRPVLVLPLADRDALTVEEGEPFESLYCFRLHQATWSEPGEMTLIINRQARARTRFGAILTDDGYVRLDFAEAEAVEDGHVKHGLISHGRLAYRGGARGAFLDLLKVVAAHETGTIVPAWHYPDTLEYLRIAYESGRRRKSQNLVGDFSVVSEETRQNDRQICQDRPSYPGAINRRLVALIDESAGWVKYGLYATAVSSDLIEIGLARECRGDNLLAEFSTPEAATAFFSLWNYRDMDGNIPDFKHEGVPHHQRYILIRPPFENFKYSDHRSVFRYAYIHERPGDDPLAAQDFRGILSGTSHESRDKEKARKLFRHGLAEAFDHREYQKTDVLERIKHFSGVAYVTRIEENKFDEDSLRLGLTEGQGEYRDNYAAEPGGLFEFPLTRDQVKEFVADYGLEDLEIGDRVRLEWQMPVGEYLEHSRFEIRQTVIPPFAHFLDIRKIPDSADDLTYRIGPRLNGLVKEEMLTRACNFREVYTLHHFLVKGARNNGFAKVGEFADRLFNFEFPEYDAEKLRYNLLTVFPDGLDTLKAWHCGAYKGLSAGGRDAPMPPRPVVISGQVVNFSVFPWDASDFDETPDRPFGILTFYAPGNPRGRSELDRKPLFLEQFTIDDPYLIKRLDNDPLVKPGQHLDLILARLYFDERPTAKDEDGLAVSQAGYLLGFRTYDEEKKEFVTAMFRDGESVIY